MSHTNRTTNLQLPQFIASDKPTWLGDVNGAMLAIDTAYGNIEATANGATSTANNALTNANNAVTTANQASSDASDAVSDASLALTTANNAISTANSASSTASSALSTANSASSTASSALSTANSAISKANALETLVGDDDISSIGDGSVTGAINELAIMSSDMVIDYSQKLVITIPVTQGQWSNYEIPNSDLPVKSGFQVFTFLLGQNNTNGIASSYQTNNHSIWIYGHGNGNASVTAIPVFRRLTT